MNAFPDAPAFHANIKITLKNDLSGNEPHVRNGGCALVTGTVLSHVRAPDRGGQKPDVVPVCRLPQQRHRLSAVTGIDAPRPFSTHLQVDLVPARVVETAK